MPLLFISDVFASRKLCSNISIVPDTLVENPEAFGIFINSPDPSVEFSADSATVNLQDSSSK